MTSEIRLHLDEAGSGDIGLILLHPNPLDGSSWLYQVAYFSTWFRTVTVDLPGYGHSPPLVGPITLLDLADAIWAMVRARGIERAIVAGVSVGAALALHMTRRHPEWSVAAIISGYGWGPDRSWADRRIQGYEEHGLAYREEHLRSGFSDAFRSSEPGRTIGAIVEARKNLVDVPSVIELMRAHAEPEPEELYADACPTLLIMGSEDYAFERSRALHEHIEGSEFSVIEGAGHACHLERPDEWDALAHDFLARRTEVTF